MKAVILAAGVGSRLRPITNDIPKCMVPVNGIRIIDKQIDNLLENNVLEIYVVSGYKCNVLSNYLREKYESIHIIRNSSYEVTNNMYSLYITSKFIKGEDFLLMNSDVYFDSSIITGLLNMPSHSAIACDNKQFIEESMKITLDGRGCINHINKKISKEDAFSVSIDVYKIGKESSMLLFDTINQIIEVEEDKNSWTEVALDQIFNKTVFMPYVINGRWFEIDNNEDLKAAEQIFKR